MAKEKVRICTPVSLPERHLVRAAEYATSVNPANRPLVERAVSFLQAALTNMGTEGSLQAADVLRHEDRRDTGEAIMTPQAIAILTTKYWGADGVDLSVSFMETTTAALQNKILQYMNRWGESANVKFRATNGAGDVRISRGQGGYWSYLGTDVRQIPRGQQTMNLQGFTLNTPDSEYERVVCHETGHTLGCPHEHMRQALVELLDPEKTIAYFKRTQGWSAQETREQVLTPLSESSLMATPADQDSVMCYQLPASITTNGEPIRGGSTITSTDAAFMSKAYPKATAPSPPVAGTISIDMAAKLIKAPAGWKLQTQ